MRILHLASCRGWSSDAYWAARAVCELQRRGHDVTLGLRAGTEERVLERARRDGITRATTFAFASGVRPVSDAADIRRLLAALPHTDVVHVHRGKEHWLAALANRLSPAPRPIVRTRHIVHPVRPHAANRWLYRRATALVIAVTDAIGRQLIATGLADPERVVTLSGGVDTETYRPGPVDPELRRHLGGKPGVPLLGLVGGLRVMKGHAVVVEAAARLARVGVPARFAFVGRGSREAVLRDAIRRRGLDDRFTVAGFSDDLVGVMRALEGGIYVPLESDGMSRVLFEYLAAGVPVIASRVGVVPEILTDGEDALLVPAGDGDALADAITRLVDDVDLRQRLGHRGRRLVEERYSGACLAAALEAQYERLRGGVTAPTLLVSRAR